MKTKQTPPRKTLCRLKVSRREGQLQLSLSLPWPWFLALVTLLATPELAQLLDRLL